MHTDDPHRRNQAHAWFKNGKITFHPHAFRKAQTINCKSTMPDITKLFGSNKINWGINPY